MSELLNNLLSDTKPSYKVTYKEHIVDSTERFQIEPALTKYIVNKKLKYVLYQVTETMLHIIYTENKIEGSVPASKEFMRLNEYDLLIKQFETNMNFIMFQNKESGNGEPYGNYLILSRPFRIGSANKNESIRKSNALSIKVQIANEYLYDKKSLTVLANKYNKTVSQIENIINDKKILSLIK